MYSAREGEIDQVSFTLLLHYLNLCLPQIYCNISVTFSPVKDLNVLLFSSADKNAYLNLVSEVNENYLISTIVVEPINYKTCQREESNVYR